MSKYSQERIIRIFDEMVGKKTIVSNESIPQITGDIAFERLGLKANDVLLDVGTGTGDKAIRAARLCRQAIGIDISRRSLKAAYTKASKGGLNNVTFAYGSLENPCSELDLFSYGITKILTVYSLHHLPDLLKKKSLKTLVNLLHRPGRMVIADLMFFDDPSKYRRQFDEVAYDDGDTDFPSRVEYLTECLKQLEARVRITQVHPLVGVLTVDWA